MKIKPYNTIKIIDIRCINIRELYHSGYFKEPALYNFAV